MKTRTGGVGAALLVAVGTLVGPSAGWAQAPVFEVEVESGPTWQSYNDVEIPNDGSASRFSLRELAGSGPWSAGRLYVTWNVSERHGLRALAAPFSLTESGPSDRPLRFAGRAYEADVPLRATYTFDSYRLTYRYRLHAGERGAVWVGGTAKLRDATIALRQGNISSGKDDLGFVPLLHLAGEWRIGERWRLLGDADALAGGPGRAVDAALKLGWRPRPAWSVRVGYRMVEGGADVPDVYAFAWLHFAAVSLAWRP